MTTKPTPDLKKYLLTLTFLVLIGFCVYLKYAFAEHRETLVREKAFEKQLDVRLLGDIIDRMAEMGVDYEEMLLYSVQDIEKKYPDTYAQVFDEAFNPLTIPEPDAHNGKKYNPLDYPEFKEAVKSKDFDQLKNLYSSEETGDFDITTYFQWMPSQGENRYLVTVGISKYTITKSMSSMVLVGATVLIIIMSALMISTVMMLCRLGYIYKQRRGDDKWRMKLSS